MWVRNSEGSLIKVSVLQESNSELNIFFNQMEHLEGEQYDQYPVERNPNAYRSMRDHIHPPRLISPSCIVPPTEKMVIRPHIVPLLPTFHGMESENPYSHIREFEEVCNTFKEETATVEVMKLKLFPFTLKDKAKI